MDSGLGHRLKRKSSSDDLLNRLAKIDCQPFASGYLEPFMIDAQLVQHRGVDVGDVMPVFDGVEAQVVGRAVGDSAPLSPPPAITTEKPKG